MTFQELILKRGYLQERLRYHRDKIQSHMSEQYSYLDCQDMDMVYPTSLEDIHKKIYQSDKSYWEYWHRITDCERLIENYEAN